MKDKKSDEQGMVPQGAEGPVFEVAGYLGRRVTPHSAALLVEKLMQRKPEGLSPQATAALKAMEDAKARVYAAVWMDESIRKAEVAVRRNAVVAAVKEVMGVLALRSQSRSAELAARARPVLEEVFGVSPPEYHKLSPGDLWIAVDMVRSRLKASAQLRKRLEVMVEKEVVDLMDDAHEALGHAVGLGEEDGGVADLKGLHQYINRCIDHYAMCVGAMAVPGDERALRKVERALEPILAMRDDYAKRKARTASRGDDVDDESTPDDEEELEEPELPAPIPISPSPTEIGGSVKPLPVNVGTSPAHGTGTSPPVLVNGAVVAPVAPPVSGEAPNNG
jgi:hypothetical protein